MRIEGFRSERVKGLGASRSDSGPCDIVALVTQTVELGIMAPHPVLGPSVLNGHEPIKPEEVACLELETLGTKS